MMYDQATGDLAIVVAAISTPLAVVAAVFAIRMKVRARFWSNAIQVKIGRAAILESRINSLESANVLLMTQRDNAVGQIAKLRADNDWWIARDKAAAERRALIARQGGIARQAKAKVQRDAEQPKRIATTVLALDKAPLRPRADVVAGILESRKAKQSGAVG